MAKVTLSNSSTTKHGDKTTETTREPKYTTRTEQTISGFYNPDNTPNLAAQDEFERQKNDAANLYHVDPNTGKVRPQFLTEILGVDPEELRRRREEEEELNRRKQRESALYNGLAILGDMATTAAGGNVWQRQPDQHAKEAREANLALEREQLAEDIANNEKIRSTERQYAADVQKIRDAVSKAFSTKISRSEETGGNSKSVTKTGDTVTTGSRQEQKHIGGGWSRSSSSSSSSSSGSGGGVSMFWNTSDGGQNEYKIKKSEADHIVSLVKTNYGKELRKGDEVLLNHLLEVGMIYDVKYDDDGRLQFKWDEGQILNSGYLLMSGKNKKASDPIYNYIKKITKSNPPIAVTKDGKPSGWGSIPSEEVEVLM